MDTITRRRLLSVLRLRWDHRVTLVVGGAGLGKTTLLAQAVAENEIEPRGLDVWIGLDARDTEGSVADDVLRALDVDECHGTSCASAIADALWNRAPQVICLIFDDVHKLSSGSPAHQLLADLVGELPANGHLLLAGRTDPALPIARLAVESAVLRLTESQLRYDDRELAEVAAINGIDQSALAGTGGWPAMAALIASAGGGVADEYLWQEVIGPLGHGGRRILAALVELGGADDALMSAALGTSVSLHESLDGVPLVDVDELGWYRPHELWRPMARLRLTHAERDVVLGQATRHLIDIRQFDIAFRLVEASGQWDEAPEILRASCLQLAGHPGAERLRRWLRASPDIVLATASGLLASAVYTVLVDPDSSVGPLRRAIVALHDAGDVDGESAAIAQLGRVAWWIEDASLWAEIGDRIQALRAVGHPVADALASIGRAMNADLQGDEELTLNATARPIVERLGGEWQGAIGWLRGAALYSRGDLEAVVESTGPLIERYAGQSIIMACRSLHHLANWYRGHTDGRPGEDVVAYDDIGDVVGRHDRTLNAADLSRQLSFSGDVDAARTHLVTATAEHADDRPIAAVRVAQAEASLLVALGDEEKAAELLRETIDRHGIDRSSQRRAWRDALCLTYVLLPETRSVWDGSPIVGAWAHARRLSAAVVAARRGIPDDSIRTVDVSNARVVCRLLHFRFAAELAVGLASSGRADGTELLDELGSPGRSIVRELAAGDGAMARAARDLLATVPIAPPVTVQLGVLGALQLCHDGAPADGRGLRRERVRALLAYLTVHRTATRAVVAAALWPDLDGKAGANNLRVTLNHLLQALEPWRAEREPSYLLRGGTTDLRLVRDPRLVIDVDRFDEHLAAARAAERDGVPSEALDHYVAAAALWRGELFADVTGGHPWLELERELVRSRYAAALVRAAQLLTGRGRGDDVERSEQLATRALEVDPWSEPAYAVLVTTALVRGDRSTARRMLERAAAVAAELGVTASEEIIRLGRRVRTTTESHGHVPRR